MANYFHILFYSLIGGVVSLLGAVTLIKSKASAERLARYATPFAAGALLAAVFMDLLKEGIAVAGTGSVLFWAMVGVVLFFFAERFLHWFHHHHQEDDHPDPTTRLVIVGDTLHNALDGVAIAAAFLISVPTGIVTTIAVAVHEIPQEIGDFGLLLSKGVNRRRVLLINIMSAFATTLAALLTFALGDAGQLPLGSLLGLSAGFLLYIATSDIIPDIHEHSPKHRLFDWQPFMLLLGVITVSLSIQIAHHYIDQGQHPESSKTHAEKSEYHSTPEE